MSTSAERSQAWREANAARINSPEYRAAEVARVKAWREANRDRSNANARARNADPESGERRRASKRAWRQRNAEQARQARRDRYAADPERERSQQRAKAAADPESWNAAKRAIYAANRQRVRDHYGHACACCGATDDLTIDHIGGNGKTHRESMGLTSNNPGVMYRWLIREGLPAGFQTLCRRCNRSKGTGDGCRLAHGQAASA